MEINHHVCTEQRTQTWITKTGPIKNGAPKWIEVEIWREADPYAPAGQRARKLLSRTRYKPASF